MTEKFESRRDDGGESEERLVTKTYTEEQLRNIEEQILLQKAGITNKVYKGPDVKNFENPNTNKTIRREARKK